MQMAFFLTVSLSFVMGWSTLIYSPQYTTRLFYYLNQFLLQEGSHMNLTTFLPHPFLQAGVGGILIGLASWLLLASLGRVAGISGIAAGALIPTQGALAGERAWRWAFVAGLVLVGAAAAVLLNTPTVATRPLPLLAVAGLLVGFGTVLGSGCTSGHGVCGLGRRSVRSLVATLVFMGMGAATVFVAAYARTLMAGV
jgi:uncharacterized protein